MPRLAYMRYLLSSLLFIAFFLSFLFVSPSAFAGGCTSSTSVCVNQKLPNGAKPGQQCGSLKNYVYGKTSVCFFTTESCIPSCGLGDWWCCDPKPGYNPSPATQPPPCVKRDNKGNCLSVETAIGTISTDPANFVNSIFRILLGFAGGVATLLIIASGYEMMTSQGNPEKVKGARERLTSAIVGLIFIIFSVAILQIIGVDILQIPGFSR